MSLVQEYRVTARESTHNGTMIREGTDLGRVIAGLKFEGYTEIVRVEGRGVYPWRKIPVEKLPGLT